MRECKLCHETMPLDASHFYRVGTRKHLWSGKCKRCIRDEARIYISQVRTGVRQPVHRAPAPVIVAPPMPPPQPATTIARTVPLTKTCKLCRRRRPSTDFYPNKRSPHGLHSWCKTCCKARQNERRLLGKGKVLAKPGDRTYIEQSQAQLLGLSREERISMWRNENAESADNRMGEG